MRQKLLSTVDRRGIEHRLQCNEAVRGAVSRAEWKAINRAAECAMPRGMRVAAVVMVAVVLVAIVSGVVFAVDDFVPKWEVPEFVNLVFTVSLIGTAFSFVVGIPVYAVLFNLARRRVYEGRGFCGSCGTRLGGDMAEEDGCVVCPGCGAAWKVGEM